MSDKNIKDNELNQTPENDNENIVVDDVDCAQDNRSEMSTEQCTDSKKAKKGNGKAKEFFKKLFIKKNLKWTIPIIVVLVTAITLSTVFIALNAKKPKDDKVVTEYLTLNHYSVELEKDQSVELEVKKFDENGKELTIKDISYVSEAEKVVTVKDGVLTAGLKGQTYVHVTADGLKVACFVSVVENNDKNGLEINMVESCLYKGIPVQVYVYEYVDGVGTPISANITWSVSDSSVLSMSSNTVTALKVQSGEKIKASFTYKGEEYNLEYEVVIEEPFVYLATSNEIKLAGLKTYSGANNASFTSSDIKIIKRNVLDNTGASDVFVSSSDSTPTVSDDNIVNAIAADGTIKVSAKKLGQTNVSVAVKGTSVAVGLRVTVVTPISTVEDMDALALACHRDTAALAADASYMMVNDIDYEGQVAYPIAPTSTTTNNSSPTDAIGIQWKYLVEIEKYENEKPVYKFVDREKVGTYKDGSQTEIYGLTDEEFVAFAKVGGLNPYNAGTAYSGKNLFKGTFDGNGFAIKNAKIMNAAYLSTIAYGSKTVYQGRATGIFGYVSAGTIKNIGFVDISMQSLNEFGPNGDGKAADGKDLYRYYDMAEQKIVEKGEGLEVINTYTNCAIIRFAWNKASIKNVYVEFDKSNFGEFVRVGATGALIGWSQRGSIIENCVVNVKNTTYAKAEDDYSVDTINEYTASDTTRRPFYYNTISIGVKTAFPAYADNKFQDGNVWTRGDWADLKNETVGSQAKVETVKTLDQIIASFDSKVWDFTALNNGNGAPVLINGCSING